MSSFFDRGRFLHFSNISMAFLLGVLLPDQYTSRKCQGCEEDSESHKNVNLVLTFLRVTVERSREKRNSKKQGNSSVLLYQKTVYLKVLQKVFEITTKSSSANLTPMADAAADLPARNLTQRKEFHDMTLSSLPDYFWSKFRTSSVVKPLNKLFSAAITSCCFSVPFCCFFLLLLLTMTRKDGIFNITSS